MGFKDVFNVRSEETLTPVGERRISGDPDARGEFTTSTEFHRKLPVLFPNYDNFTWTIQEDRLVRKHGQIECRAR
jgi:hypothetical protein